LQQSVACDTDRDHPFTGLSPRRDECLDGGHNDTACPHQRFGPGRAGFCCHVCGFGGLFAPWVPACRVHGVDRRRPQYRPGQLEVLSLAGYMGVACQNLNHDTCYVYLLEMDRFLDVENMQILEDAYEEYKAFYNPWGRHRKGSGTRFL